MKMQPYPSQKDQMYHMYHGPHFYPRMEAVPSQGYVDPARPPMGYGCWPWGSSYGGASPMACHGCYNHSYLPAHCNWGFPYAHPPMHHCPGNYPSFPVQYMPPSYYGMEPPRYEYEKDMPKEHHCCGCVNHPLHHREQKHVKIEEEEPERLKRRDDSVVPYQFKNSPYPIVWLPSDYSGDEGKGEVHNKVNEKDGSRGAKEIQKDSPFPVMCLPTDYTSNIEQGKAKNTRDSSPDVKMLENGKLLPLDLNKILPKNSKNGEGNQQNDGKENFPFPLFWIPYKHEEKEKENQKKRDASVKPSLEAEVSNDDQKYHASRDNTGDRAATKVRDIPVKDVEQPVAIKGKEGGACYLVGKDNGEKKASSKEDSNRKSSSPQKSSKLPPVCLRVDPLPRRKSASGSSRSPSPPGNKQKPDSQSSDASKVFNPLGIKEQAKILSNDHKEDTGTKTIEVDDGKSLQGKTMDVSTNQAEEKPTEECKSKEHTENDAVVKGWSEDVGLADEKKEETTVDEVKNSHKTTLSEEEAAVILQSAYRGFEIRRWEPLKKLREIAKVREQITDVKRLIQTMESSVDIPDRRKQRNIIAETIMSLLLKLDTIQGLTPIMREVRKSVVKELVNLQEQLDSSTIVELEDSQRHESAVTPVEDSLNRSEDVITSQKDVDTFPTVKLEARENKTEGDGGPNENSVADLIGEQASRKIEEKVREDSTNKSVVLAAEPTIREDEKSSELLENGEATAKKDESVETAIIEDEKLLENGGATAKRDDEGIALGQGSGTSPLQENSSAESVEVTSATHDIAGSEFTELPIGVLDDLCVEEGRSDPVVEAGASKVDQEKQLEELVMEPLIISEPYETMDDKDSSQTPVETHEIPEPPSNIGEQETQETCPNNWQFIGEEVDGKTGDASIESDCIVQQPQDFIAHTTAVGNYTTGRIDCSISSVLEKPQHESIETEIPSHPGQAGDSKQDANLANESEYSRAAAGGKSSDTETDSDDCITLQNVVTKIEDSGEVHEQRQPPSTLTHACQRDDLVSSELGTECNTEQPMPAEALGEDCNMKQSMPTGAPGEECNTTPPKTTETLEEQGSEVASNDIHPRDEIMESNRKLMEENQKLRGMMENLIKSGEEQLSAISSLYGRVKDLEKKLSRKRKLKVKHNHAPRLRSSCMTTSDDTKVAM